MLIHVYINSPLFNEALQFYAFHFSMKNNDKHFCQDGHKAEMKNIACDIN